MVGINKDGSYNTQSIENLRPGDMVLTKDQNDPDAKLELKPVVRIFHRVSDHLRILKIRSAHGNVERIVTTDSHPFFVHGLGWLKAGDLQIGTQLDQANGSYGTLISSVREAHPEGIAVYNVEVKDDHTYFVEDGSGLQRPIWVHNSCNDDETVDQVLRRKKGDIKDAPLEKGSPSWEEIRYKTIGEIRTRAKAREPGYKTFLKLLTAGRFNK